VATVVYALCALTSLACTLLLLRGWSASRARLLLWATIGFLGLALNNIVLFVDKVIATGTDLSTLRTIPAFVGLGVFALGLVWDEGGRR
jgi:hypothetical protein